ncbi:hypothetical protein [Phaeodactylibacter luteus]|uniref:hypothetical protein n=1 Tax=Phaeodactylibacter luteus TaxID=1564516 RepID=UPI00147845DA|nr:hypothetical protein [Phaeodactylibacter luteus]
MKTKDCALCGKPGEVMFRVQLGKGKPWVFVCKPCCEAEREKPGYRYGGTWKGARH